MSNRGTNPIAHSKFNNFLGKNHKTLPTALKTNKKAVPVSMIGDG